jgi:8-oxo-dGTP diphosphatase
VPFTYKYPRPAVTVDAAVFSMRADDLAVLLIRRKADPFKGAWALPGGFVDENEPLDRACARELSEETGITNVGLEQLGAFGDPGRDPRGHTVSVAFYTYIVAEPPRTLPLPAHDAAPPVVSRIKARMPRSVPRLAFDHAIIIEHARIKLHERLHEPWRAAAFHLLPPRFTLIEFQRVYEAVLGRPVDKRTFRATIARPLVAPATEQKKGSAAPRSQLYRWKHGSR